VSLALGCPELNSISLAGNMEFDEDWFNALVLNSKLRSVALHNNYGHNKQISNSFLQQIASIHTLTHLNLRSFIFPVSLQWLIENTQLEELIIEDTFNVKKTLVIKSGTLRHLSMCSTDLMEVSIITPKLKSLNISFSKIEKLVLNCPELEIITAKKSALKTFELRDHSCLRKCKFCQSILVSIAIESPMLRALNLTSCPYLKKIEVKSSLLTKLKTAGSRNISTINISGCDKGLFTGNFETR